MTERELRAVTQAIRFADIADAIMYEPLAQAAISASDSQYVKGLVEALKECKPYIVQARREQAPYSFSEMQGRGACKGATEALFKIDKLLSKIENQLQNLPEDLR